MPPAPTSVEGGRGELWNRGRGAAPAQGRRSRLSACAGRGSPSRRAASRTRPARRRRCRRGGHAAAAGSGRSAPCLQRQRVLGGLGGGAGRLGRGLEGGVADGVLGLDVVAQAGGAAVHHRTQGIPTVARWAAAWTAFRWAGAGRGPLPSARPRPRSRPGRGHGLPPRA